MRSPSTNNKQFVKSMRKIKFCPLKNLKKIRAEIWIALILIFALFLRLYFFIGIGITDDLKYVWSAWLLSTGQFEKYPINIIDPLRSMMVLPLAFIFFILGVNMYTAAIYPLFCSLGTIFLTYLIGKFVFNEKVGLLASFLLSIIPLDIVYSTQLIPSTPLIFFTLISIYLFLLAERHKNGRLLDVNKHNLYLFFSGVFVGLSYLTNELAFLTPLIFLAYSISNLKIEKNYLYVVLGFLTIFLIECIFFYLITQDPFWRLKVIHETELTVVTNLDPNYYPRILTRIINPDVWAQEGKIGIFFYVLLFSSFYLLIKKDKKSYFFILWLTFILLYLQFGVMTLTFRPIAKWARYLIIILPPWVLVISRFFDLFGIHRNFSILILSLIIITTPYYIIKVAEVHDTRVFDFKNIYSYLKTKENKTIYTDLGSFPYLDFYFGYKRKIIPLESVLNPKEIRDSFVIINGSPMIATDISIRERLPGFILNIPEDWELLKVIEGPKINIYAHFDPKIYYVR